MLEKQKQVYLQTREKLKAFEYALTIINWDTETEAPLGALERRSEVIGVISSMYNDLIFNQEYVDSVNYLFENRSFLDETLQREIFKVKKNLDSTLKLPKELIIEKIILGSHAAMKGENTPESANTRENSMKRMYENVMTIPIPRCSPIPPRTFLLDSAAPITVRINIAAGDAMRLCISILY
jgi:Zn-dependent M32 family carboxypeptidase